MSSGLPIQLRMEEFSRAYLRSLIAQAGCVALKETPDVDGIDVLLKRNGRHRYVVSPHLSVQLKSTMGIAAPAADDAIKYRLDVSLYDRLRSSGAHVPSILVVLPVPKDLDAWIDYEARRICLHHRAYWRYLAGEPSTPNTTSVTVELTDRLDAAGLVEIMNRVKDGNLT